MIRISLLALVVFLPITAHARSESWGFVQSIGGIVVEAPVHTKDGWVLPVQANVSGLETITQKPTILNSALICKRTEVRIEKNNIYLTLVTGITHKGGSPRCPHAELGNIASGKYRVFYRGPGESPFSLREVEIGL
jgi:hypothetical protein